MQAGEKEIAGALERLKSIALIVKVTLIIVLSAYCLLILGLVIGAISSTFWPDLFGTLVQMSVPDLIPLMVHAVLTIVLLIYGIFIFRDVSVGESPFTLTQSKRVRRSSAVFLLYALFDLVCSPSIMSWVDARFVNLGYWTPDGGPVVLQVDVGVLIAAVLLFCLSLVFKYGALLQRLSDETA